MTDATNTACTQLFNIHTAARDADMLNCPSDFRKMLEPAVLDAAFLAGSQEELYPEPEEFARNWQLDWIFMPQMSANDRSSLYTGGRDALSRTSSGSNSIRRRTCCAHPGIMVGL